MRAAVLRELNTPLTIEDIILESPKAGEVLVRIEASGICQSDVATAKGIIPNPLPVVLGHEGSGVVEEVGAGVTSVKPGDHVMLSWAPECGTCRFCRSGHPNLCSTYAPRVLDGGLLDGTTRLVSGTGEHIHHYSFLSTFAEKTVVPESSCIRLDDDIPMIPASLIGCAVMTGYGAAVKSGRVGPGDTVVVLGSGGVGVNAIQGARIAGAARIIAVDAQAGREASSRLFGATDFVDVTKVGVVETVLELTRGEGADVVIEASGNSLSMNNAYHCARRGGTVVFVGVAAADSFVQLPASRLPREEKHITGSFYGGTNPALDFPILVNLYRQGKLLLDEQVDGTITLDQINSGIDNKPQQGVRTVVSFSH
ncbi:MAG: Zn-dependent alcohol dehydrogenase [Lacisediminihabitans sp.]